MSDCPTPKKRQFRSPSKARRWHRRARIGRKARLHPYRCPAGHHWHLTHIEPGWKTITPSVDAELRVIAERSANQYSDYVMLSAPGWTREELCEAILARLRNRFIELRDAGQLEEDETGLIRRRD